MPVPERRVSAPYSMTDGTLREPGTGATSQRGEASWYDPPWGGFTAAHPWLPFGTRVTVTDLATGRSVTVVIDDRGPFGSGRVIDLSPEAFAQLEPLGRGVLTSSSTGSSASARALARATGVRPSKSLGQHFLLDTNLAAAIARDAGVGPGTKVVEIGAGLGSLTVALADAGADRVVAVEFDRALLPGLEQAVAGRPAVEILQADATKVEWPAVLGDGDVGVLREPAVQRRDLDRGAHARDGAECVALRRDAAARGGRAAGGHTCGPRGLRGGEPAGRLPGDRDAASLRAAGRVLAAALGGLGDRADRAFAGAGRRGRRGGSSGVSSTRRSGNGARRCATRCGGSGSRAGRRR